MAGWSMVADDSTVDGYKTPKKLETNKLSDDLKAHSKGSALEEETEQLVHVFESVLQSFLKEFCSVGSFRPLPPLIGNGKSVDLFKLFLDVSDKGGFDTVSKNGLWKMVAEESGLKMNPVASIKLIYVKYLDAFGRWLNSVVENESDSSLEISGTSMELEAELKCFLSEMDKSCKHKLGGSAIESRIELKHFLSEMKKIYDEYRHHKEPLSAGVKKVVGLRIAGKRVAKCLVDEDVGLHDSGFKENSFLRKRKRESMWEMLKWVVKVAKNPCDPEIGSLPEISKWSSYGSDEIWKQVLLFRTTVSQRRHIDSSSAKYWQNHQKMHPCMYNDGTGSSYNLRERLSFTDGQLSDKKAANPEVPSGKDLSAADSDNGRKYVRIGLKFQVEVLEWTGVTSESDLKWLGTRVWPPDRKQNSRLLIERDPIGRGRQDSCACPMLGSVECVRFHVSEKLEKLKLELGPAFHSWEFNKMGEKVAVSWSTLEQKKVNALMKTPPILYNTVLEQMAKIIPSKTREDIVSYFYNVILLRHRAKQNRSTPCSVDSDEDEPGDFESATEDSKPQISKSPKPILLTPKKPNRRVR